ncbi:hypothetical protein CKO28_01220 [Rhodovibrio sodomensis]|uniref:RES domain-containing protein n=1 Tax=Rhodovibrio sodomensis TaxID=1088 RepID=A0ABS1D9G4_9PROT|nr:hypothetical protein [Rhodovibrio sodomensis]MBK1666664.1 hypothetical protein [Rhodovibrio sodomensis]
MLPLYHGCPCLADAARILQDGLRQIPRPHPDPRRARLAPIQGRVYLTPDFATAVGYATTNARNDWRAFAPAGDHAVVFEVAVTPNRPDLWPDEDTLGDAVVVALRECRTEQHLGRASDLIPGPALDFGNENVAAAVGRDRDLRAHLIAAAETGLDPELLCALDQMDPDNPDGVAIAEAGKTLLDRGLHPELRRRLLDAGTCVSLPGPVSVDLARRVPRETLAGTPVEPAALMPWPEPRVIGSPDLKI